MVAQAASRTFGLLGRPAWIGPGGTILVHPAGGERPVEAVTGPLRVLPGSEGPEWPPSMRRFAASYFESGGRNLWRLEIEGDSARPETWLGEDGGPGERTGLLRLLESESAGTAILPEVGLEALSAVVACARRFRDLLVVVPVCERGRDGLPPRLERPAGNVVAVAGEDPAQAAGRLVAQIEESERRHTSLGVAARRAARALGLADRKAQTLFEAILLQRRWRGVVRSLDLGTRWVVFEPHLPEVWRRVERDVRAFLLDLARKGYLTFQALDRARVECGPLPGGEPRVSVRVELDMPCGFEEVEGREGEEGDLRGREGSRMQEPPGAEGPPLAKRERRAGHEPRQNG